MCLSGQPALKVRLAGSSKRDGNEWAWVANVAPTAAAVWAERTWEFAVDATQNARAVSELVAVAASVSHLLRELRVGKLDYPSKQHTRMQHDPSLPLGRQR